MGAAAHAGPAEACRLTCQERYSNRACCMTSHNPRERNRDRGPGVQPDETTAVATAGIEPANYIGLRLIFVPDTLDGLGRVKTGRHLYEVSWRHMNEEFDKMRATYLQGSQSLGVDPGGLR